jgi:hypothetical protein
MSAGSLWSSNSFTAVAFRSVIVWSYREATAPSLTTTPVGIQHLDHGIQRRISIPFNNYLYKVELARPASYASFPGTQSGTTKPPPDGVSALVIKLSKLVADECSSTSEAVIVHINTVTQSHRRAENPLIHLFGTSAPLHGGILYCVAPPNITIKTWQI